jgi:hypothetical protein
LQLDADGYWVKLAGFTHSGSLAAIRRGGQFLGALSESGKPVVCFGAGSLHLVLLVADISSSIGIGESESFQFGERRRHEGPRKRLVYHPAFARSFHAGLGPVARAFAASQCRCREHPPGRAPDGSAIDKHNVKVRVTEAGEARTGPVAERREWLRALTALGSWFSEEADAAHLSTATADALLAGIDEGRERRSDAARHVA